LPNCSRQEAAVVAERLRASMRDVESPRPITISIGVATSPQSGSDVETLVRAADAALYEAKHRGRNRVAIASMTPVVTATG
ncbi:MAG: GGDEF domain-containing protein, partial [Actinomycetota bacterium]|nr:GGDEF domain-containing protein [Actinomycetota bacterium]